MKGRNVNSKMSSLELSIIMLAGAALAAPSRVTDLKLDSLQSTSCALVWTVPISPYRLVEYDVRLSTSPISALNWNTRTKLSSPLPGLPGSIQKMTVSGLLPGTLYYFGIKTKDTTLQWSIISNLAYGRTLESGPQSVTLAWDPSPDPSVVGYKIHIGTGSGVYSSELDPGNVTSANVSGLLPGATYFFAATAYDAFGLESGYSNEVSYSVPQ